MAGHGSLHAPLLPFGDLFYGLRDAGVKVGPSDWMGLMQALAAGVVQPSLSDFYQVSRALLIKHESHFDAFDQVFAAVFAEGCFPVAELEAVLDWLKDPIDPQWTSEDLAALESLPLDELRRRFEERLEEQTRRHDGGNRWVGTGGTSPFGHGGKNPSGVRVGGSGGARSAIQVATARHFKPYRHDRPLDDRSLSLALKRLRRLSKRHQELELDVDGSIEATSKNAGELELRFRPPRKNEARVILLMDVGGSMDPYSARVEKLFSAAHRLQHFKSFEAYTFHNCVYDWLEPARPVDEGVATADLLRNRSEETFMIFVGDAAMAPSELMDVFGAISYRELNQVPAIVWLHRLRRRFPRSVWLNPLPERWWGGFTTKAISQIFAMFPLTVDGLDQAVDRLLGRGPPLPDLQALFPFVPQARDEG